MPIDDAAFYRIFHIYPFACGFLFYCDKRLGRSIDEHLKSALVTAVACTAAYLTICWTVGFSSQADGLSETLLDILRSFCTWFWLIALVGLGRKYLRLEDATLRYANQASYPFYILHQTVIALKYLIITILSLLNRAPVSSWSGSRLTRD